MQFNETSVINVYRVNILQDQNIYLQKQTNTKHTPNPYSLETNILHPFPFTA